MIVLNGQVGLGTQDLLGVRIIVVVHKDNNPKINRRSLIQSGTTRLVPVKNPSAKVKKDQKIKLRIELAVFVPEWIRVGTERR
jgi:hypothetical protein